MMTGKKWYAVYTRPRWEKKVAALLVSKNINSYCPLSKSVHQWSDRKKLVEEPLFRSYVFVNIGRDEMLAVKQIDGVLNFVEWLRQPAVIRDEEIAIIKKYLNEYENVHAESMDIKVDDTIRITNGPLVEMEGRIASVGKNKVKVYLESLRYVLIVEVERARIQLIKRDEHSPASPLRSSSVLY